MAATGITGRAPRNLEIAELDRKDRADTAKALRRLTTLVIKHAKEGKELLEMVSYLGPRATAKPGEIGKKIYATGAIHPQSNCPLANLPAEVLHRTTTYLPLAPTVALALTCKALAARVDAARSHIQILYNNVQTAKDIARGKPLLKIASVKAPPHSKPAKLGMLILLKSWFPANHALCYRCLKYKERGKRDWTTNREISDSGLATQKAIDQGPKCPRCSEWIALQNGKNLEGYTKLLEGVKKYVK